MIPCIPKCCPPGEVIDMKETFREGNQTCVKNNNEKRWSPVYYKHPETLLDQEIRTNYSLKRTSDWVGLKSCNVTVVCTLKGAVAVP